MKRLLALALALFATPASAQQFGVNLSGCAVGPTLCPDQDEITWWMGQGFKLIRVPFRATTPIAGTDKVTDMILAKGGTVVLDLHEMKTWPPVSEQVAAWAARAARFKGNPRVIIDIRNEPHGFTGNPWVQWARDTKAIIAGLRAAGFTNTIAVEWPGSSASFRFDKSERTTPRYTKPCESAMCAVDRQGGLGDSNVLFEAHRYFDPGSPGVNKKCTTDVAAELASTRAKAARRGYKLFLGESAFANWQKLNATCAIEGAKVIAEIKAHPETWWGVTWWGAGREWPSSYLFAAAPKGHREATAYLRMLAGK